MRCAIEEIMFLKAISLIIWLFSVASVIFYVPMAICTLNNSKLNSTIAKINIIFILILSIFSIVEILVTIQRNLQ